MAKIIDITDKLELGGNPFLKIGNTELEVNADAGTVLKIMGKYENDEGNVSTVMDIYNLVFPEETREKIDALHLSFADLKVVIEAATDLIMGTGEESPEGQTHTTTSSKITI